MKILYAAHKYDYGDPARGHSYEHYNLYESLFNMGHDVLYFDLGTLEQKYGKRHLSQRLLEVVQSDKPDLLFAVLQRVDDLEPSIVQRISDSSDTCTVHWFCDDHWRFESFSQHWAPRFNWAVTTARSALPKYRAMGYMNVIKSQWGCNHVRYHPVEVPTEYDVTFVGLPHGDRRFVVDALRRSGVDVQVWGKGWENGRVDQARMIQVFSQSRINLNLSNSSVSPTVGGRAVDAAARLLERSALNPSLQVAIARKLAAARHYFGKGSATYPDQIKGRNFEVPGCGGFLLTGKAENLEDYYVPNKEVATFAGLEELITRVRHYLRNTDEREAIARAGYERTMREHTYVHRFVEIFECVGLSTPAAAEILTRGATPGASSDID